MYPILTPLRGYRYSFSLVPLLRHSWARIVTGRHVTCASATTKIKTCLDTFLFLAGHSRSVALFFSQKFTPNGHSPADCRTLPVFFWLVSRATKSAPNT